MSRAALLLLAVLAFAGPLVAGEARTTVSIEGEQFHVNGRPTYEGREWKGHRIEGLLGTDGYGPCWIDLSQDRAQRQGCHYCC